MNGVTIYFMNESLKSDEQQSKKDARIVLISSAHNEPVAVWIDLDGGARVDLFKLSASLSLSPILVGSTHNLLARVPRTSHWLKNGPLMKFHSAPEKKGGNRRGSVEEEVQQQHTTVEINRPIYECSLDAVRSLGRLTLVYSPLTH